MGVRRRQQRHQQPRRYIQFGILSGRVIIFVFVASLPARPVNVAHNVVDVRPVSLHSVFPLRSVPSGGARRQPYL